MSKMHKNHFNPMSLRCAIDEASRIEGLPSDAKPSTAMLAQGEKSGDAGSVWPNQSPRRHLPAYRARSIGGKTSANHAIASSRAKANCAVQARSAEFGRGMAAYSVLTNGPAINEFT
ncbi:hypothetical protein A1D31_35105 [Bradyrhizobium liaoningense]|nr:hypothetical protein A1D31_35105 [Bradyrhizobium liaoningense]